MNHITNEKLVLNSYADSAGGAGGGGGADLTNLELKTQNQSATNTETLFSGNVLLTNGNVETLTAPTLPAHVTNKLYVDNSQTDLNNKTQNITNNTSSGYTQFENSVDFLTPTGGQVTINNTDGVVTTNRTNFQFNDEFVSKSYVDNRTQPGVQDWRNSDQDSGTFVGKADLSTGTSKTYIGKVYKLKTRDNANGFVNAGELCSIVHTKDPHPTTGKYEVTVQRGVPSITTPYNLGIVLNTTTSNSEVDVCVQGFVTAKLRPQLTATGPVSEWLDSNSNNTEVNAISGTNYYSEINFFDSGGIINDYGVSQTYDIVFNAGRAANRDNTWKIAFNSFAFEHSSGGSMYDRLGIQYFDDQTSQWKNVSVSWMLKSVTSTAPWTTTQTSSSSSGYILPPLLDSNNPITGYTTGTYLTFRA